MGKQLTFDFDGEKDYTKDIENILRRSDFIGMSVGEVKRKIRMILEEYKFRERLYEYGINDSMDTDGDVEIIIFIKENPLPASLRKIKVRFETIQKE